MGLMGSLPFFFYQKHWKLCGEKNFQMVSNAFLVGKISNELNHTLIVLIPKNQRPKHMHLFQPFSLCSTVYKVLQKYCF